MLLRSIGADCGAAVSRSSRTDLARNTTLQRTHAATPGSSHRAFSKRSSSIRIDASTAGLSLIASLSPCKRDVRSRGLQCFDGGADGGDLVHESFAFGAQCREQRFVCVCSLRRTPALLDASKLGACEQRVLARSAALS